MDTTVALVYEKDDRIHFGPENFDPDPLKVQVLAWEPRFQARPYVAIRSMVMFSHFVGYLSNPLKAQYPIAFSTAFFTGFFSTLHSLSLSLSLRFGSLATRSLPLRSW